VLGRVDRINKNALFQTVYLAILHTRYIYFLFIFVQFVRLAHDTKADVIYELMTKHWKIEAPQLLISVTGGAKSFNLDPRLKQHFASGLLKVCILILWLKIKN